MKRSVIALTTLLTATLALSSVARADRQTDKQAAINAGYQGVMNAGAEASQQAITNAYQDVVNAASKTNDYNVNQEFAHYAPSYTRTETDIKVYSLEQVRQNTLQSEHPPGILQERQVHINFRQWKNNGQVANVLYDRRTDLRVYGNTPGTQQAYMDIKNAGLYEDTWHYTNSGWKLVNTRVLQENTAKGEPHYPQASQASNADRTLSHAIQFESLKVRNWWAR